jgi:ATP-dependent Zn protease
MDERRRRTAYHEAGHAVASYAKGIPVDSASISKVGDSLGRVISDRETEYWRDREGAEEVMFALIVESLAGI